MQNYCNICGKYYYNWQHTCYGAGGTANPYPFNNIPASETHYHYAKDLCGGHCWCKEEMVGEIKHRVCCNCGLRAKI